ncbi:STIP1 y and U box-containing protein 1 [Perkinsus olseni]|uniref:STIP1 y and U box-containing protein 1 n=1 Tax=Perkinsus olseni TaxID=32597 RepID=A0A7J6PKT2_PEROL|nr:STIP1 y and U box-containing protein 1 [Perkinsus olseni]
MSTENQSTSSAAEQAEQFKKEGNAMYHERKFRKAIELYTKAIDLDGNVAAYYSNRALANAALERWQEVFNDAEHVLAKLDKSHHKAVYWVVKASKEMGKPKDELVSLLPDSAAAIAEAWGSDDDEHPTQKQLEYAEEWGVRISEAIVKGRMDNLQKILEKIPVGSFPSNVKTGYTALAKYYMARKEWAKGLECFRKLLQYQEKRLPANEASTLDELATTYNNIGVCEKHAGNPLDCSIRAGSDEKDQNLASIWSNMGSCQVSLGKMDEAIKCHKKAVEIATSKGDTPKSAPLMLALARALRDAGNNKEADGLFGRVVAVWSGFSKVEDLVKESPDVPDERRLVELYITTVAEWAMLQLSSDRDASVKTADSIRIMESGVATLKKWGRQAQAWRLLLPMAQISDDKKYLDEASQVIEGLPEAERDLAKQAVTHRISFKFISVMQPTEVVQQSPLARNPLAVDQDCAIFAMRMVKLMQQGPDIFTEQQVSNLKTDEDQIPF